MSELVASDRAPGLAVSAGVKLPDDLGLGANVVIHGPVRIGAGCTIQDGAVIGKPEVATRGSSARSDADQLVGEDGPIAPASTDPVVLEDGATVCARALVHAGVRLGEGAIVGDQANVRANARVGPGSVIGRNCSIGGEARIGARVRFQTNAVLTPGSLVEDDAFIGPCVVMTNDQTAARVAGDSDLPGATLRRACRIGAAAVLLPGVEIGEEAFIAAGAVVLADVPARAVMMGVPARHVRDVPDDDLVENWR